MSQRYFSPDQGSNLKKSVISEDTNSQRRLRENGSTNKLLQSKMTNKFNQDEMTVGNYSYRKSDEIGSGYSSKVYKAISLKDNQQYAIKVIDTKKHSSSSLQMLENEIEILKKMDHPNIIKLYNVYKTQTHCYLVTQLCKGDLLEYITRKGKLSQKNSQDIMAEVVEGVKYLFKMGVLHRDLKPANILRTDKNWKIADFGFSIQAKDEIRTKQNVGTPLYMPIESLLKNLYSAESDIFSVGIIYYELLIGVTPWQCRSEKQLIKKLATQPFHIPEKYKLSSHIKYLLQKLCSVDKTNRMSKQEFINLNLKNFVSLVNFNEPVTPSRRSTHQQDKQQPKRVISLGKGKSKSKQKARLSSKQKNKVQIEYKINRKGSGQSKKITAQGSQMMNVKVYGLKDMTENEQQFQPDRFEIINYNILLSQLNYCRFMYYIVENVDCLALTDVTSKKICLVLFKHLLKIIKQLADLKQNCFNLPSWDSFRQSPKYLNLIPALQDYCQKYQKEYLNYLKQTDINIIKQINQKLSQFGGVDNLSVSFYRKLMVFLTSILKECSSNMPNIEQQVVNEQTIGKMQSLRSLFKYYKTIQTNVKQYENYAHFERYSKLSIIKNFKLSDVTKEEVMTIRQEVKSY